MQRIRQGLILCVALSTLVLGAASVAAQTAGSGTATAPRPKATNDGNFTVRSAHGDGEFEVRRYLQQGMDFGDKDTYVYYEPLLYLETDSTGKIQYIIDEQNQILTLKMRWHIVDTDTTSAFRDQLIEYAKRNRAGFELDAGTEPYRIEALEPEKAWLEFGKLKDDPRNLVSKPMQTSFKERDSIPVYFPFGERTVEEVRQVVEGLHVDEQLLLYYEFEGVSEETCVARVNQQRIQNLDAYRKVVGEGAENSVSRDQAFDLADKIARSQAIESRCPDLASGQRMIKALMEQLGKPKAEKTVSSWDEAVKAVTFDENSFKANMISYAKEIKNETHREQFVKAASKAENQSESTSDSSGIDLGIPGVGSFGVSGGSAEARANSVASARKIARDSLAKQGVFGEFKGAEFVPKSVKVHTKADLQTAWGSQNELRISVTRGESKVKTVPLTHANWTYGLSLPRRSRLSTRFGTQEAQFLEAALGRQFGPEHRDPNGWTDLHYAAVLNDVVLARHLVDQGARIDNSLRPTGHLTEPLQKNLHRLGYDVGVNERILQSPLHIAAQENATKVIELLGNSERRAIDQMDGRGRTPLHYAAATDSLQAARELMARNANVNKRDRDGKSPLHIAAEADAANVIRAILEHPGSNPDLTDSEGNTPLHIAAKTGSSRAAVGLLSGGRGRDPVNVWMPDRRGRSALHLAVRAESLEIVTQLVSRLRHGDGKLSAPDRKRNTPLHYAAQLGREQATAVQIALVLLRRGARANARDKYNQSPLHYAARYDHSDMVIALLDHRADIDALGGRGDPETPLLRALRGDSFRAARTLLERGAVVHRPGGKRNWLPLHHAAAKDNAEMVRLLLEAAADVTRVTTDGATALHLAARRNAVAAMEALHQDRNIQVDARTKSGDTPLHVAASKDATHALEKLLLWNPGLLNETDNYGRTPLHDAAEGKAVNAMSVLVAMSGIYLNARDNSGASPLHYAVWGKADPAVALLLGLGNNRVNIDLQDEDGNTPLHEAARRRVVSIVEKLLQAGADPRIPNRRNKTALNYIMTKFPPDVQGRLMRMVGK